MYQVSSDFHIWKPLLCLFSPVARILQNPVQRSCTFGLKWEAHYNSNQLKIFLSLVRSQLQWRAQTTSPMIYKERLDKYIKSMFSISSNQGLYLNLAIWPCEPLTPDRQHHPTKWDRTGIVIPSSSYQVRAENNH